MSLDVLGVEHFHADLVLEPQAVADLIDREPDPAHAVIGLRNHGITATGDTLTEILDRIEAKLLRQVPMT